MTNETQTRKDEAMTTQTTIRAEQVKAGDKIGTRAVDVVTGTRSHCDPSMVIIDFADGSCSIIGRNDTVAVSRKGA